MLTQHWNAFEIWSIQMTSKSESFIFLFRYFSVIILWSEIFNPYPFIVLGFERPDAKLFMYTTENMTSHREVLVPRYTHGLKGVTTLLSKAAPLTDLYIYLRNHPLQNPAKAKVHYEHGFFWLRLAVKDYLDVSFFGRSSPSNIFVHSRSKKCKHLVPKALRRWLYHLELQSTFGLIMYMYSRSTSCPLYSDLNLDFEEGWTFNDRWPLAIDSDSTLTRHWAKKVRAVENMRELPEMIALRSRAKNLSGSEEPEWIWFHLACTLRGARRSYLQISIMASSKPRLLSRARYLSKNDDLVGTLLMCEHEWWFELMILPRVHFSARAIEDEHLGRCKWSGIDKDVFKVHYILLRFYSTTHELKADEWWLVREEARRILDDKRWWPQP